MRHFRVRFALLILAVALETAGGCAARGLRPRKQPTRRDVAGETMAVEFVLQHIARSGRYEDANLATAEAVRDEDTWLVRIRRQSNPQDYYLFTVDSRTGVVAEAAVVD